MLAIGHPCYQDRVAADVDHLLNPNRLQFFKIGKPKKQRIQTLWYLQKIETFSLGIRFAKKWVTYNGYRWIDLKQNFSFLDKL
jgi:hypothetical protein